MPRQGIVPCFYLIDSLFRGASRDTATPKTEWFVTLANGTAENS